ncbi:hypothetical protein, partial [Bradyrhizobium sp.]|uniref:hypothetical protein n=1 Tax=Bradyrhizobium sp. TaxID=376 RepID=UPI003C77BDE5
VLAGVHPRPPRSKQATEVGKRPKKFKSITRENAILLKTINWLYYLLPTTLGHQWFQMENN